MTMEVRHPRPLRWAQLRGYYKLISASPQLFHLVDQSHENFEGKVGTVRQERQERRGLTRITPTHRGGDLTNAVVGAKGIGCRCLGYLCLLSWGYCGSDCAWAKGEGERRRRRRRRTRTRSGLYELFVMGAISWAIGMRRKEGGHRVRRNGSRRGNTSKSTISDGMC